MTKRRRAHHRFRGRLYRLRWGSPREMLDCVGQTDPPQTSRPEMLLDPRVAALNDGGFALLDLALHESLHACYFDMSEDAINEAAADIAAFLFCLGFRREENMDAS